ATLRTSEDGTPMDCFESVFLASNYVAFYILRFVALVPRQRLEDYAEYNSSVMQRSQLQYRGIRRSLVWSRHNRAVGMQAATFKSSFQIHNSKHLHPIARHSVLVF